MEPAREHERGDWHRQATGDAPGPGRYSAWTLAALPNPQRAAMDLLVDTTTGSRADIMRSSDGGNSWRSTAVEVSGYTCPPLVSPDPPPHPLCLTLRLTPSCRA